jgi:hypothetical protein
LIISKLRLIWLSLFLLLCTASQAQNYPSNIRKKNLIVNSDTMLLDTAAVLRGSIVVYKNNQLLDNHFQIYNGNYVIFDSTLFNQTLQIHYRVVPLKMSKTYFNKSENIIEPIFNTTPRDLYNYQSNNIKNNLFSEGINANGNIARGIGFGNNQDLVINSNMNIQLNGKLGKGISLIAAISDENNPIQPEGNTQQIQDFDKVFISILKDSTILTMGDFLMNTNSENYFLKYYKKSRGLQFDHYQKGIALHHLHADGAVSRGKFVRNEFQGVEGNQGPYRLNGANGEFNIIVISGTEVVYIDGEKMDRGEQNDYVIDYNTGEIVFMPSRLITKFNRMVVEFQYSDRNYGRTVFTVSDHMSKGNWFAKIHYFSEQDNKLQPTDTSSANSVRKILEQSGDQAAFFDYKKKFNEFQANRVNYRLRDSSGNQIYEYTNNPTSDTAFYTLVFSLVGQGNGNYVQIASSANGRVYAWVDPVNGIPQGNYEPYVQLVAPKRLQMLTSSVGYNNQNDFKFNLEGAYSNYNTNTYSTLDKSNDDGLGLFLDVNKSKIKLGKAMSLQSGLKMEYISSNFQYVERYRSVEFNRIWNRQLSNIAGFSEASPQLISTLNSVLNINKKQNIGVELSQYSKGNSFKGYRGFGTYNIKTEKANLEFQTEQLTTTSNNSLASLSSEVHTYRLNSQYDLNQLLVKFNAISEDSRFKSDTSERLNTGSFRYQQIEAVLQSTKKGAWNYNLKTNFRTDDQVNFNHFSYSSSGFNLNGGMSYSGKKQNRLNMIGSYRKLNLANTNDDEETILGRIEYNSSFLNRSIISSTYYQIGTGREQKRTYSFALVQAGFGTHTWNDYNGNGIEEINEFEPAIYSDQAKYVKVYLPGNEFIKSNSNEFNQSVRIQAPILWQGANKWKRWISKFNTVSSYKADRRITDNSLKTIINPFDLNVADTALIAVNSLIKQTTFFNRSNAKFGLEHSIQSQRGKQFLYSGFESRRTEKNQLISRLGILKKLNLVLELERAMKENLNNFFENRNYRYQSEKFFPELFFQSNKGFRIGTYYKYTQALNAVEFGNDQAYISEYGLEMRYFIINRGNIDAKLASHQINYNGNPNSPLAFDLLNGLSHGQNLTWNLTFGGKAINNVQFNLNYEGRKTPVYKTVHIGRAEARFIF